MLLFGSFSEDETRSLLLKQTSGGNKTPVPKKQLQFGSLNYVTGGSSVGIISESSKSLNSPKAPDRAPSSGSHKSYGVNEVNIVNDNLPAVSQKAPDSIISSDSHKCTGVNSVDIVRDNLSSVSGAIKGNRSFVDPSFGPSNIINEKEVKDNVSYSTPDDVDGSLNQFANLKLDGSDNENLNHVNKNGGLGQDSKKASNGHVSLLKDLLPRGLINSGNLCFLNATVQALLSCAPFVQLLQELRTREIPKVSIIIP